MDVFYAVKQLAHEIDVLEAQIQEKKTALHKVWGALTPQEQLLIDSPSTQNLPASVPQASMPAPEEPKPKKSK